MKHTVQRVLFFYRTWCAIHSSCLSTLSGILRLKISSINKSEPDTFWWANTALSFEHYQRCIHSEWLKRVAPSPHKRPRWAQFLAPCSLNQIAISCVENDRAAIIDADTTTSRWQLPITHLHIAPSIPTMRVFLYPSSDEKIARLICPTDQNLKVCGE